MIVVVFSDDLNILLLMIVCEKMWAVDYDNIDIRMHLSPYETSHIYLLWVLDPMNTWACTWAWRDGHIFKMEGSNVYAT